MRAFAMLVMLAGGCTISVDVITKVDSHVRFDLAGLGSTCSGTVTGRSGDSVTTVSARAESSGRCRIDLVWDGPLVDARALRDKVDQNIRDEGYEPDEIDVSVDGIDVTFRTVVLADGELTVTPPRVPEWSAEIGIAGTSVAAFEGEDVTALLEIPRTFPMPDPAVEICEKAYEERRVVMGDGSASLLLAPADFANLAARGAPALVFEIRSIVYATASKRII